jgi:H+/gluconate symporter-like permease
VPQTVKTWTIVETIVSICGLAIVLLLGSIVG